MGKGDLVPRIITRFGAKIRLHGEEEFRPAWPVNLSETGLCVRIPDEITEGQLVEMLVRLGKEGCPTQINGRIVWVRHDELNEVYYCGVGFVDLGEEQLGQIRAYVERGGAALLEFLSEFPLFESFSQEDCRNLLKIVTLRALDKKEILYREGARDVNMQGLFIVQSGLLSIFKGMVHRPEKQLAVASAGQIFGETTLLVDQPHTASVMAVNDSRLIQINKIGFQILREKQPELALKIMEVVAQALVTRLGRTTKKLFSPVRV